MSSAGRILSNFLVREDPLFLIGISSPAFLGQDGPDNGNRDLADHDGKDEKVDGVAAKLPVGSIECEQGTFFGFWKALQDEFAK